MFSFNIMFFWVYFVLEHVKIMFPKSWWLLDVKFEKLNIWTTSSSERQGLLNLEFKLKRLGWEVIWTLEFLSEATSIAGPSFRWMSEVLWSVEFVIKWTTLKCCILLVKLWSPPKSAGPNLAYFPFSLQDFFDCSSERKRRNMFLKISLPMAIPSPWNCKLWFIHIYWVESFQLMIWNRIILSFALLQKVVGSSTRVCSDLVS